MTVARSSRWQRAIVLLAALVAAAGTARLGVWQLSRAAQKTALHEATVQRAAMPPLAQAELAPAGGDGAGQWHRRIELHGRWDTGHTVFLDNRQMNGRPGFFVVTPLRLATGDAVLVQRGWVPVDAADRTRLPPVPTPSGDVRVAGRIAPPPSRLYEFADEARGPIRQNLDPAAFERDTGLSLRPVSVLQTDADELAADGLKRQWPQPAADVAKHHGYAFQWFALSALVVGLTLWFQVIRPRHDRPA
jgi:surfeit locus 1 family protein